MGVFDNIKNKAEELVGKDNVAKAEDFAAQHSDKVEQYSDQGLDAASQKANDLTGGKYADHIDTARTSIDERVGNEGVDPAVDPALEPPVEGEPQA